MNDILRIMYYVTLRSIGLIKGIIFNLGGTLTQDAREMEDLARQGAEDLTTWYIKKRRIKLDPVAFPDALMTEREVSLRQAEATQREVLMRDTVLHALERINAPEHAHPVINDGVPFFFQAQEVISVPQIEARLTLKKLYLNGYKVGLFTNANEDGLVQRLVNNHGFRPWIAPVFSSASIGWRTPNPAGFLHIAKCWRVEPQEIIVVSQHMETDGLGAQQAGMFYVFLQNVDRHAVVTNLAEPSDSRQIMSQATIQQLSDLFQVLAKWDT